MARKSDASPRYYHLVVVLGDRDDDLRTWCLDNPGLRGRAVREALRDWIEAHPDASAAAASTPPNRLASPLERPTAPRAPAPRAKPRPAPSPVAEAVDAPAAAIAVAPEQPAEPDTAASTAAAIASDGTAEPSKVSDEARAQLRRMLQGSKAFL